jgi:hypothetical protein
MDLQSGRGPSGPASTFANALGVLAGLALAVLVPLGTSAQSGSRGTLRVAR